TVEVVAKDKTVNAKSIMGIMSLGLAQGEELKLVVNGEDEEVALAAMVELVESGFGE
ncbi:HPr family phosphocarrier protein, partial [Clostridioides difficile]